jgi:phosphoesterase RecJ-like protein
MENHKIEAHAIKNAINAANSILLVAHKKPDADTLGSVCAWINLLEPQGKSVEAFCLDPVPEYLRHLPGSHKVQNDPNVFQKPFDLIIVNDSGDLQYAGIDTFMTMRDNASTTLINIDHHTTNPKYGDLNLVLSDASSNSEVLTRLFKYWDIAFSKQIAECLLHGIVTDTDKMTNPATSYQSLAIASELIEAGADLYGTIQRTLAKRSITDLKLWGLIMERLKYNERLNCVVTYVTDDDIAALGADPESLEPVSNYLSLIPNVNFTLFLQKKNDGIIKGSFRTVKDTVDVGRLALLLGGGGHRKAAGFRMPGSLTVETDRWTIM